MPSFSSSATQSYTNTPYVQGQPLPNGNGVIAFQNPVQMLHELSSRTDQTANAYEEEGSSTLSIVALIGLAYLAYWGSSQ